MSRNSELFWKSPCQKLLIVPFVCPFRSFLHICRLFLLSAAATQFGRSSRTRRSVSFGGWGQSMWERVDFFRRRKLFLCRFTVCSFVYLLFIRIPRACCVGNVSASLLRVHPDWAGGAQPEDSSWAAGPCAAYGHCDGG